MMNANFMEFEKNKLEELTELATNAVILIRNFLSNTR